MKIALPVDENNMETRVCVSFGRAPYFAVYDTETKETSFFENKGAFSKGGAGVKTAQIIVDNKIDAVISPRCGENAAEVINAADIKIYKTINDSIKDNIGAFEQGKLNLLSEIHEGFHNHGK